LVVTACLLTALAVTPSLAAQLGDIPVTAEFAAGMRAIAAMDPDEKIRNPDTMARQFLSPAFWFWTALDEDYDQSKKFIKFYRVSSYYSFNACTKHIDGILQDDAGNGLQQVVIIGAGLDSRAYRFHKQMPEVRFFEVDLPAAVARKKELVQAAVGKPPATVSYVAVDYRNGGIAGALKQVGYDHKQKTLFICEGVTRYIDAASVDRTMQFIAKNSAAGSELVFDYIPHDIASGDFSKMPWARFQAVRMAAYGHPWKFGIAKDKAGEFVTSRGFEVISDLGSGELAQRYLVRSDGSVDGKPTPYFRIMHAVVKK
jgi:methyltransferase (TIGR00027 family)